MGFGTDLQGRASHDALLHLQDTEIRLLETFKKCMTQRIYADKEYAAALGNVVNTATKLDIQQHDSPVFKVRTCLLGFSVTRNFFNVSPLEHYDSADMTHLRQFFRALTSQPCVHWEHVNSNVFFLHRSFFSQKKNGLHKFPHCRSNCIRWFSVQGRGKVLKIP